MRYTPSVYLDCIHAKVRDSGAVRVKAVYLALGVNLKRREGIAGPVGGHQPRGRSSGSRS